MDNTIQANTNFKSVFLINYRAALPSAKQDFERIFSDKEGNVEIINAYLGNRYKTLYIADNIYNRAILKHFSTDSLLSFICYRGILNKIKSNINDIDKIVEIIKKSRLPQIRNTKDLWKYICQEEINNEPPEEPFDQNIELTKQILQKFGINEIPGKIVVRNDGVVRIRGNGFYLFNMSPPDNEGHRYVRVKKSADDTQIVRCLVDKDGFVMNTFRTRNGIKYFNDKYRQYQQEFGLKRE